MSGWAALTLSSSWIKQEILIKPISVATLRCHIPWCWPRRWLSSTTCRPKSTWVWLTLTEQATRHIVSAEKESTDKLATQLVHKRSEAGEGIRKLGCSWRTVKLFVPSTCPWLPIMASSFCLTPGFFMEWLRPMRSFLFLWPRPRSLILFGLACPWFGRWSWPLRWHILFCSFVVPVVGRLWCWWLTVSGGVALGPCCCLCGCLGCRFSLLRQFTFQKVSPIFALQVLVGSTDFLEFFLSSRVFVFVRMPLLCQWPVRLLDLILSSSHLQAQCRKMIFCHPPVCKTAKIGSKQVHTVHYFTAIFIHV